MSWKVIILAILEIVSVISQFVNSDQIIIGEVELVSYGNPLNKTNETQYSDKKIIYFQNKRFDNAPKIIIGYSFLDYDYNTNTKSFEIQFDNVTRDSFQMQFIKYQDTKVYKIVAVYAAIESDDVFWNQVSLSFENWPLNNQVVINQPFSRPNIDSAKVQRKAVGFFTSLKSDGKKYVKRHKIQVKIEVGTSSIDISALQDDPDQSLNEIKVNYFEYYVQTIDPYYDITIISDLKYIDNILRNSAYYQSIIKLDYTNKNDLKGIISAINMIDIPLNQYSGRIEISNKTYNNIVQEYSFNYRIWYDTQIYAFSATTIAFKMKDCSNQNLAASINDSFTHQCVKNCVDGYIISSYEGIKFSQCLMNSCNVNDCSLCDPNNTCVKCNPNFYFYKKQCWNQQPPRTFCDSMKCTDCLSECQTCENSNSCTSCIDFYLYNGKCVPNKPIGTYCDRDKLCKSCKNPKCNCDEKLDCITCSQNQYFYQNICYEQKPDQYSVYCDEQSKICFPCNAICKNCVGPKNTDCTDCNKTFNKLNNNKCECITQYNGFDLVQENCQLCNDPQCKDCYGDYKQCLTCFADSVLVNGKCECKDQNKYFDSYYKNCLLTTVENCKIAKKNQNECEKCKDGYLQDTISGKCTVCPNSMYADSQNKCSFKCRPNCLICVNDISCFQEIPIDSNTNDKDTNTDEEIQNCHFSCSKCTQPKSQTSCLICSSDTRSYNPKTNECLCDQGYQEVDQQNCQKIADLDEGMAKTFKVVGYISLGIQSIFLFGLNSPDFQYLVILQQYLYLQAQYPQFDDNLQFCSYLSLFRHFSIFSLFESIKLFSDASIFLNSLIIYTSVLVVTILIGLSFQLINFQFSQASYFRWNLIFLIQRSISLFSFYIIFKLILRDQLYTHSFTISVVSCFMLFYFLGIGLHIKGIYKEQNHQKNQTSLSSSSLDNSQIIQQHLNLKNSIENSMEKPILNSNSTKNQIQNLEIETINNFQQSISYINKRQKSPQISPFQALFSELDMDTSLSKYFWLIVECRKFITGFIIGFLGDKVWSYYTLPSISFIFVVFMQFNKIQTDQKKRKLVFCIEFLIICVQVFTSFYFNQLNSESNDQNQILIFIISCCIFITSITLIVFQLAMIIEYLKERFDFGNIQQNGNKQQQSKQTKSQNNMRMQPYFTKDQISAVLDPTVYNSNKNPRSKRIYNY